MSAYISLIIIAVIPVIASIILYYLFHETKLKQISRNAKQAIAGIVFGVIAICGTEFGISLGGAIINARDAAPLCAGLIFGGPAGLIAGFMGGIERWFSVYWGVGYYTRLGCTLSTIMTGIIAAVLRTHMFDDKIPAWDQALLVGIVCEVMHMLSIFFTNISDVRQAFLYVRQLTVPMVIVNAVSVTIAVIAVNRIRRTKKHVEAHELPSVAERLQRILMVALAIGFTTSLTFTSFIQRSISEEDTERTLRQSLEDTVRDVTDQSDDTLLHLNHLIAEAIAENPDADLKELTRQYNVSEINLIDENGIIIASSENGNIGTDIQNGSDELYEFMRLLYVNGPTELVREYSLDEESTAPKRYSGVKSAGGIVQIAYDDKQLREEMSRQLQNVVTNRHIGETGILIVMDGDRNIVSSSRGSEEDPKKVELDPNGNQEYTVYKCTIDGKPNYYMYTHAGSYLVAGFLPAEEADFSRVLTGYLNTLTQAAIFGILFAAVYIAARILIVRNIWKIDNSLSKITAGNLDTTVDVHTTREFDSLSAGINQTVDTLKRYIAEANERIDSELHYAAEIQSSALPSSFPAFPGRDEFDIYALMHPAKEIGGDFYDFYMIDNDVLAFIVADVSGKGIPAALFMMRAMTTMHTYAQNNIAVADIFTNANFQLCEGNDAGLFVTAWMGFLNLRTGELKYANAGHNLPLLRRRNGTFEYLKSPAGFVLGGMEGIAYKEQRLVLEPGDELFIYTDGVVEATNTETELYGDDRLQECLNSHIGETAEQICISVKADVDRFYTGAPQFDDITELSLQYLKPSEDEN